MIPSTKRVDTALSEPNFARAHFVAVKAPDFSRHLHLVKFLAMHTQQHVCKDTVCEHLYIPRTVGVLYMKVDYITQPAPCQNASDDHGGNGHATRQ